MTKYVKIYDERCKVEEVLGASLLRLSFICLVLSSSAGSQLGREEQPRLSVIKTGGRPLQIVALGRQFEVSFHL